MLGNRVPGSVLGPGQGIISVQWGRRGAGLMDGWEGQAQLSGSAVCLSVCLSACLSVRLSCHRHALDTRVCVSRERSIDRHWQVLAHKAPS